MLRRLLAWVLTPIRRFKEDRELLLKQMSAARGTARENAAIVFLVRRGERLMHKDGEWCMLKFYGVTDGWMWTPIDLIEEAEGKKRL